VSAAATVPFQILSLSGGGYLGLYTIAVLAELEEQTGRRTHEFIDLFAGTSIGGILSLGLAAGISAADIRDAFLEDGQKIFGSQAPAKGPRRWAEFARSISKPKHVPAALRATVERIVGAETLIKDLKRPAVITAVNLTKGGPKVFKTGHHANFKIDWRLPVAEVALATSAAPTYFPTHRIGNELFADGGLFANSPDAIALHEAEHFLEVPPTDVRLLSIGTTTQSFAFSSATPTSMGVWDWVKGDRLSNAIIGSQQALTDDMLKHRLGERYLRIDRTPADAQRADLALDCASSEARSTLLAMARNSFAEFSANPLLRTMVRHDAAHRPFINASM
jgi:predicted acylesterase/phospholipase RssA